MTDIHLASNSTDASATKSPRHVPLSAYVRISLRHASWRGIMGSHQMHAGGKRGPAYSGRKGCTVSLTQGKPGTMGILSQMILCCEGLSCACKRFGSTTGLYPLEANSIPFLSCAGNKHLPTLPTAPRAAKSAPAETRCSTAFLPTLGTSQLTFFPPDYLSMFESF